MHGVGDLLEVSNLLRVAEAQTESSTKGVERLPCPERSLQKARGKDLLRHASSHLVHLYTVRTMAAIAISQLRTLRLREVTYHSQSHTANRLLRMGSTEEDPSRSRGFIRRESFLEEVASASWNIRSQRRGREHSYRQLGTTLDC